MASEVDCLQLVRGSAACCSKVLGQQQLLLVHATFPVYQLGSAACDTAP